MPYSNLKNKTILITGGTGFFGKVLREYLLNLNDEYRLSLKLILTARKPVEDSRVCVIASDVRNKFNIEENVDYIIHAATPVANDKTDTSDLFDIIINGTQNVLNLSKEKKITKLINISSGAVYGKQPIAMEKIEEDYIDAVPFFDRTNSYGTGKRIAEGLVENFCRKNQINYLTLRCFAFSGKHLPLDAQFAIGNFVRDGKTGMAIKINGDGSAIRSYLDSSDLAEWILTAMLSSLSNETYNVGSDEEISIADLAKVVSRLCPMSPVQFEVTPVPGVKSNRYVPSNDKIKAQLGVTQKINLEESIIRMLKQNEG